MTDEQKQQYLKASATLENLKALKRTGRGDPKEIAELELVAEQYRNAYDRPLLPLRVGIPKVLAGFVQVAPQQSLLPEVAAMVDKLREEREQIDYTKNRLSDSLTDIPDTLNCRSVVQEIKQLREVWVSKGDEMKYVIQYGQMPEQQVVSEFDDLQFVQSLPIDVLDLDKKIKNRGADLSKYKKRLQLSKTGTAKAVQERNIAQAETEIAIMKSRFNALRK
jgi:hypothetical protein